MKSTDQEPARNPSDFRIVTDIRKVCSKYANEELGGLQENLRADQVNGILSRILARILLDSHVAPWMRHIGLFVVERAIFSRLHIIPYYDLLCVKEQSPGGQAAIKVETPVTLLSSGRIADTPQLFFEPLEFLFEEHQGEFIAEEDISQCKLPAGWERRDSVLIPHQGYLKLIGRPLDYWTEMFMLKEGDLFWYSLRAYSARFENLIYGVYAVQCLDSLGAFLRSGKAVGIRIRSAFLVPVAIGAQLMSNFLFISEQRTIFFDRTALIALAQEITNWYLHAETRLLEQRYAVTTASVPSALQFTHEARNILTTMDGSLRSLREKAAVDPDRSVSDLIRMVDLQHARLLEKINDYETNVRYPREAETSLTTRELAESLGHLFTKMNYKGIVLAGLSNRTRFYLKGSVADLFQFIETLVQNGLSACAGHPIAPEDTVFQLLRASLARYNFAVEPYRIDEKSRVLVGIQIMIEAAPRLRIQIRDTGTGIPPEILDALYEESTFSRLPSDRIDGGRGLLSAISALHALYQANCLYQREEKAWDISIPIRLERPVSVQNNPAAGEELG